MENTLAGLTQPRFRSTVKAKLDTNEVLVSSGATTCSFSFDDHHQPAVARLLHTLENGNATLEEILEASPEIAEHIPDLMQGFDKLRLLVDSAQLEPQAILSGRQLYREVRRLADRTIMRVARSSFQNALLNGTAIRAQLIGYALEYYWLVKMAPGLIAPALATSRSACDRDLMQGFLKSELGHDRFLSKSLAAVGIEPAQLEAHQPLPATFALAASLGVYARQHPLSFKAVLFLFELPQPAFVEAFEKRCGELGLPESFHKPMRLHADLNSEFDHGDISRSLMEGEAIIAPEAAAVVKRNVVVMIETLVLQEEQILSYYGTTDCLLPRIFGGI